MLEDKQRHLNKPLTASLQSFMHSSASELEKQRDLFRAKSRAKFVDRKWLRGVDLIVR